MTTETTTTGECPFCGVHVEFPIRQTTNCGDGTVVYALSCPNSACGRGVAVLQERGGAWTRFPPRQPKDIPGVPPKVMTAFREAVISLEAGAPRAAACMLRRTVASAASDRGVPDEEAGKRLGMQAKIDRLREHLLPATYSAAKAARILGDAAAHEEAEERLGDVDPELARRTLAVVRQFLNNLYELPQEIRDLGVDETGR